VSAAPRICSLLPSATEIVAALGEVDRLVGRSAECDFPPSVSHLPVVTSARVDTNDLASAAIDAAVRAALADGRSLYAVDADLITRLAPDLILTQDLCEVCAVSSSEPALCSLGIETLALDAHSLRGIERSILSLAGRLRAGKRGGALVAAMEAKIAATGARIEALTRRQVFVAEWLEPPFAAGHWLPEMVAAAGGVDVLGRAGEPRSRRLGRSCGGSSPSSSSSLPAASTSRARPPRRVRWCPISVAPSSPSTPTPTTRGRRHASPTASHS